MKPISCFLTLFFFSYSVYGQTDNIKAEKLYHLAMDKVFRKDYTGAIAGFTEAIKLDSVFIEAWENRGVTKYYLHDYEGAIKDYDMALEINTYDGNTYVRRGWAKFDLKMFGEAIVDFTKAIEKGSGDPGYYNTRGEAKYKLQDYVGAIADFNMVIDAWYGGKIPKSEAYFWRGLVRIDMGQKESGCIDLNKSAKLGYPKAFEVKKVYCE